MKNAIHNPKEYGFIPVKYDSYNADIGWTFVECEPKEATHVRHADTGKMYRANQLGRVLEYNMNHAASEACKAMMQQARQEWRASIGL